VPRPLPIVFLPARVLRTPARELSIGEISSAATRRLIAAMKQTLAGAPDGVGLAAPQIGADFRIFLVSEEARHIGETDGAAIGGERRRWDHIAFINPVLTKRSRRKSVMAEGCLSVPGRFGEVARAEKISLAWFDEHGKKHGRGFSGFFGRVIQHELDHLDGMLITDRARKLISLPAAAREGGVARE